ncbi:MAG: hypothetical protein JSU65_03415, partial [Candidatus Zixiibacteriota bacterium]
ITTVDLGWDYLKSFYPPDLQADWKPDWQQSNFSIYVLLKEGLTSDRLIQDLTQMKTAANLDKFGHEFDIQPMSDFYLGSSHLSNNPLRRGSRTFVLVIGFVGLLVLILSLANSIVINTARAVNRAREMALRKVLGGSAGHLLRQLLIESFVSTFLAAALSAVLVVVLLPEINQYFRLHLGQDEGLLCLLSIIGLIPCLIVGFVTGLTLMGYIAAVDPGNILRAGTIGGHHRSMLRRILVTGQICAFAGLLIFMLSVYEQVRYAKSSPLGYDRDNLLTLISYDSELTGKMEIVSEELKLHSGVNSVTRVSPMPPTDGWSKISVPHPEQADEEVAIESISVDYDFVKTLGLEIMWGRPFDREQDSPVGQNILANEAAARRFNLSQATSPTIGDYQVVGIVNDFHQHSFREKIAPTVYMLSPQYARSIAIRINAGHYDQIKAFVATVINKIAPDSEWSLAYVEEHLDVMYAREERLARTIGYFASLALLLAVVGLISISSLAAEQRTKEVAIRKVLGASMYQIIKTLGREYGVLAVIGVALAWPMGIYATSVWQQNFVYQSPPGVGIFFTVLGLVLVITCAAVGFHLLRAATANPIESIRHE